ncbi:MAG: type II toxin-antitoxin system HicB family antitoxin [Methanospirillaceae archaeon]|nr:type II toxin-antitoxin system HicB family antitoxin [Methanospirillaceae archaeon]
MNRYTFSVIIEKDEDGYDAFVPELKGCYSQGNSYEEVYERIQDAIRLSVQDQIACGKPVHQFEHVSLTMVELAV